MLEHAISSREASNRNYPIVSPALFNKNKKNYANKLFYCPKCDQYYCYGFDNGTMYCNSCFWTEQVEDACLKKFGGLGIEPTVPLEKPCFSCLAKQYETIDYLIERAAEKRKAKAKRAENRKPAKLRRLEKREEKRDRQRRKSAAIIPFAEPVTPEEAAKFAKRRKSSSASGKSCFKKKLSRIGPRTGCQPWQQSPGMRYAHY